MTDLQGLGTRLRHAIRLGDMNEAMAVARLFCSSAGPPADDRSPRSVGWKDLDKIRSETVKRVRIHKYIDGINLRVIKQDVYSWGEDL